MAYTVRPAGTEKDPFRVRLTAVSMLALKLKSGDTCELIHGQNIGGRRKLAIAWEGLGPGMKDTIVQTSKLLQEAYGFKLGDKITLARSSRPIDEAGRVALRNVGVSMDDESVRYWTKHVASAISTADDLLVNGQKLRVTDMIEFVVDNVGVHDAMLARVTPATTYHITTDDVSKDLTMFEFKPARLGGMDMQISKIQGIVNGIVRPNPILKQSWSAYEPVQGVMLYGARGTGKTVMIDALAESGWSSVIRWKPGTELLARSEPCLVIMSAEFLKHRSGATSNVVSELEALFKGIIGKPTLVVTEARHPNDVDDRLRMEGRFAEEIELPIPSVPQRKEILLALRGEGDAFPDEIIAELSDRTHGYVGHDLKRVLNVAFELARDRQKSKEQQDSEPPKSIVSSADVDAALQQVRPSALQEIFLEKPNVRWSDIGGQHKIKRQLRDAVERPLKFAERMKKLGLKPKKGVLLYGPPGCSKTLLVRALATEAGVNFLAVKGAELISMYVGESERATREVFRKARAASPCIIFFDEIDAIASRGRSGSDLHVLTTLLNEMDGFEELGNVFVVAATNKPQQIDPALMRPGRFDNVVYIGPPDLEARKEILKKQLGDGLYQSDAGLDNDLEEFGNWTEGFSGADVVAICQTAREIAFDEDRDFIKFEDVQSAVASTGKSITREMLEEFETWDTARLQG